jgi:hypothetical protein
MKKKYFSVVVFFVMILGACSNNSGELEGEVFKVFTWSPDITTEDISSDNFAPTSGLEFDFKSSSEVEVESGGEEFEGTYSLENNILNVELKDENNESSLVLEIDDFTQHEDNENLYTGTVTTLDSGNSNNHRVSSNLSLDEYLGFYKND